MKKFTSLLMGLSLALAGAAIAQQPDEQSTPKSEKPVVEKTQPAEPKAGANAEATSGKKQRNAEKGAKVQSTSETNTANPEATTAAKGGTKAERHALKGQKGDATPKSDAAASTESNVSGQPGMSATPNEKKGKNARAGKAQTVPSATAATAKTLPSATPATATASPTPAASASVAPTVAASASAAPTVAAAAGQQNATVAGGAAVKADPAKVQQVKQQVTQIKQQHASFRAQPRPDTIPAVTFNASYRIEGSDRWQGPQYEVYRSYHPERHDRAWYSSRYNRVELVGGGYYYMNNGYWYPAWGYDSGHEYYAYDAPIYVGHRAEPPDRVIADVQTELQQMGYYRGEVDGLVGPLTRQALTAYQADQGLMTTAVIDEPTLNSLGMG